MATSYPARASRSAAARPIPLAHPVTTRARLSRVIPAPPPAWPRPVPQPRRSALTAFRVHRSGLVIDRIVNEFGIARTATGGLKESLAPPDDTSKGGRF